MGTGHSRHWRTGIWHLAFGIGHWALGIGHLAFGMRIRTHTIFIDTTALQRPEDDDKYEQKTARKNKQKSSKTKPTRRSGLFNPNSHSTPTQRNLKLGGEETNMPLKITIDSTSPCVRACVRALVARELNCMPHLCCCGGQAKSQNRISLEYLLEQVVSFAPQFFGSPVVLTSPLVCVFDEIKHEQHLSPAP